MNKNFSIYVYLFENGQFERPRMELKDNVNVDLMEKYFGPEGRT
jgi:hypothetical protein